MTDLRIPSPCHEDWNVMTPRDRGRHCASCDRVVVDVSGMPGSEASTFMAGADAALARGDRVCVHARLDAHGKVLVPSPSIARGRARLLTNALAAMLALSIAGCHGGPTGGQGADGGHPSGEPQRSGAGTPRPPNDLAQGGARPIDADVRDGDVIVEGKMVAMPGMLAPPPRPEPEPPKPPVDAQAPKADG